MADISTYSDEQLFALLPLNDQQAFTVLYDRYRDKLYGFAFGLSHSEQVAYDLVQDVFMKLWEQRATLTDREIFAGYLYTMTRNFRINQLNRIAKKNVILKELAEHPEVENLTPESVMIAGEAQERLKEAIVQLPERQKQVYLMHRENGMPHAEIAKVLNLSVSTVENHLSRALQNIRKYLQIHYPEVIFYGMIMNAATFLS